MNAQELLIALCKKTGDYSLVTNYRNGNYADAGGLALLNDGALFLDGICKKKPRAVLYKVTAEGDTYIPFDVPRYVSEVWLSDGTNRTQLLRSDPTAIRSQTGATTTDILESPIITDDRNNYPEPFSQAVAISNGRPSFWSPSIDYLAPAQASDPDIVDASDLPTGATDYAYLTFGDAYLTRGLMLIPPADGVYTIEIVAVWRNKALSAATDVNFWSIFRPDVLVRAACRQREVDVFQNAERAAFYETVLRGDVRGIENDMIREEEFSKPMSQRRFL